MQSRAGVRTDTTAKALAPLVILCPQYELPSHVQGIYAAQSQRHRGAASTGATCFLTVMSAFLRRSCCSRLACHPAHPADATYE